MSSPVIVELDPRNEEFEAHHTGEPADWDIADHLEMLVAEAEVQATEPETADQRVDVEDGPQPQQPSSGKAE